MLSWHYFNTTATQIKLIYQRQNHRNVTAELDGVHCRLKWLLSLTGSN